MRMNEMNNDHHICVHITNVKRKSKSKFEMKSINFTRKRAMKKRGEKREKERRDRERETCFFGVTEREKRSSFSPFFEHETVDSSNKQQTKRREEN